MIDGVCAGVADYFQIDVTIVRVIWVAAVFIKGIGVFAYLLCMLLLPAGDKKNDTGTDMKHTNAGLVGGIILIVCGFFILSEQGDWFTPFRFRYFHYPFRFGYEFWSLVLVAAGIAYLMYAVNRNKTSRDSGTGTAAAVKSEDGKSGSGKSLYRNLNDKWVGGVCSGIANYIDIDPVIVRIGCILLALLSRLLPVVLIYVVFMVILPESDSS